MNDEKIGQLTKIIESCHLNFLIGSGASTPYLPILNNIEKKLNESKNDDEKAENLKEYFEKVMLPNKNMINLKFDEFDSFNWNNKIEKWEKKDPKTAESDYYTTHNIYKEFLRSISKLILDRKNTVLNRQVNIFTTNIDIFLEKALEDVELNYNDGFVGRLNPKFDLSNFKQSLIQSSHHFDNKSEIPMFNLVKIHGSLTWSLINQEIYFSRDLSHLKRELILKSSKDFLDDYKNDILVVNPEENKYLETVLNIYYYELLRTYSSELERENSVLFVIGFSMSDEHIRKITLRAAKSNPTLQIFIFTHLGDQESHEKFKQRMETDNYQNIEILSPDLNKEYDLENITKEVFLKIKSDETK